MLGKRTLGKGMIACMLMCMMTATAVMPSAVAGGESFSVVRHPPGSPSTDIVYHGWTAPGDGEVYLNIHNAGMASVTIEIADGSATLLSQTIRFQGDGSAVVDSARVSVTEGTIYSFSAIPGGRPDCGGILFVCFEPAAAPSAVTYTIYDMFEEDWGPWWDYRVASSTWDTERLLPTGTGDVTYLYSLLHNPTGDLNDQGLIYAPYRYNVNAVNLATLDVHDPVVMPTFGSEVAGAAVSLNVYFQYIYMEGGDWTDVWTPEWGTSGEFATVSGDPISDPSTWIDDVETTHLAYNDGYMTGTLIEVTMNREAAEEWLGMPQSADPLAWWASEGGNYLADWEAWILDQGNEVFDIYCGYEWPYELLGTVVKLGMDGSNVVLDMGHVSWGYEALITRWMAYADVSQHQPYMEDFTMTVDFREGDVDLTYDGVAQWNLHSVKQYAAPPGDYAPCAWVWEPIALDYIESWPAHPNSDYDPYASLEYTSWNCGDVGYGTKVGYEYAPVEMDLAIGRTLVIEFPTDVVVGYYAQSMPADAIYNVWNGDPSDYNTIRYYGTMSLGFMNLNGNSYTPSGNVLTIKGPADFANPHPDNPTGALLHGAPWIEFNVNPL